MLGPSVPSPEPDLDSPPPVAWESLGGSNLEGRKVFFARVASPESADLRRSSVPADFLAPPLSLQERKKTPQPTISIKETNAPTMIIMLLASLSTAAFLASSPSVSSSFAGGDAAETTIIFSVPLVLLEAF